MLQYGLAVLVLCSSSWVQAAKPPKTQKVIYPNGRVVYEAVPEKGSAKPDPGKGGDAKAAPVAEAAPAQADASPAAAESISAPDDTSPVALVQQPTPANPKLPCEGCGDGTQPNPGGKCEKHNPPFIIPGSDDDCEGRKVCTDNDNPQKGRLSEVDGGLIKFYGNCKEFRAIAPIPVIVKNQREDYIFGKARYGEKCCEYEVCVVTKCCCIDTRECELRKKEVSMRACRRNSDGTIDVYVLNEPGFPVQWVLDLGLSDGQFQAKYPGKPLP